MWEDLVEKAEKELYAYEFEHKFPTWPLFWEMTFFFNHRDKIRLENCYNYLNGSWSFIV